jgi:hypothetical protein
MVRMLILGAVSDINRIAAVIQAVMAKDGELFGGWLFRPCFIGESDSTYYPTAASDSRKNGVAAGY